MEHETGTKEICALSSCLGNGSGIWCGGPRHQGSDHRSLHFFWRASGDVGRTKVAPVAAVAAPCGDSTETCCDVGASLIVAGIIFHTSNDFGGREAGALKIALAGQLPKGMYDLSVREDVWQDYSVRASFRCKSTDLRRILENPPFRRDDTFSNFFQMSFPCLQEPPVATNFICFVRTDLHDDRSRGWVGTDSNFSFAYVFYSVRSR
jgi:hypothetical protein